MKRSLVAVAAGILLLVGCRSASPSAGPSATEAQAPPQPAATTSVVQVKRAPETSELDAIFRGYQRALPEPRTLSEGNGASLACERHRTPTYTLLAAEAERLPVKTEADVARLGHWALDEDACVRQIALKAIVSKVGYDQNRLVLPSMHERDHHLYRDILLSWLEYLEAHGIAQDGAVVKAVQLELLGREAFHARLAGRWEQSSENLNFVWRLVVDAKKRSAVITRARSEPDPGWPDQKTEAKLVESDDRRRFVLDGDHERFTIVPVTERVVWLATGSPPGHWAKLEKR